MLNLGTLFFQLGVKTSGLRVAEKRVQQFADRSERKFDRVARAAKRVAVAVAAIVTIEAARRVLILADNYQLLLQRIKTATRVTGGFVKVSKELLAIANQTGSALFDNVSLYQALSRAAPELGAKTRELLEFTRLVSQVGVIGGSDQLAMRNGMRQLVQGLSAGVFRAEEMNSILENIPELAFRIAGGMGLSVGQMRRLVIDGKLLSSDVFRSLLKQAPEIGAQFADIELTISRATGAFKNSFQAFLGQWDAGLKITASVAVVIQAMANFLNKDFTRGIGKTQAAFAEIKESASLWLELWNVTKRSFGFKVEGDVLTDQQREDLFLMQQFQNRQDAKKANLNDKVEKNLPWTKAENQLKFWRSLPSHILDVLSFGEQGLKHFVVLWNATGAHMISETKLLFHQLKGIFLGLSDVLVIGFMKAADKILNVIAAMIEKLAALSSKVPFLNKYKGLENAAESLRDSATFGSTYTAMINGRNEKHNRTGERLRQEKRDIIAWRKRGQEAANAWGQAFRERQANIRSGAQANIEQKAEERERNLFRDRVNASSSNFHPIKGRLEASQEKLVNEKLAEATARRLARLTTALSTELEIEQRHYAEAMRLLETSEQMKLDTIIPYQALRERLDAEHQKRLAEIAKSSGDQTTKEQGRAFKDQIAQAAQHNRKFFELNKAIAVAQALIDAPKAVLSAYSYGSSIGGPILGSVFAGVAAAATAVQVAAITSAQYSGAKAGGGNVFGGGLYRVNERGPEMLSSQGKDYLMMGSSGGKITPNNRLGGSGNVVVNVMPQPGQTARVQSRETQDGTEIDVVIEKLEQGIADGVRRGGSALAESLEAQYGLNRAAGAIV